MIPHAFVDHKNIHQPDHQPLSHSANQQYHHGQYEKITDKPNHKDGTKIPMQNSIIKFHDKQLISPSGCDKNINKPTTNISLHRFGLIDETCLTAIERKQPWLEDMINDNNHPLHAVFDISISLYCTGPGYPRS